MQTLQTIWATLNELRSNIQSLPAQEQPILESPLRLPEIVSVEKENGAPNIPPVNPKILNEFLLKYPTLVYKYVYKQLKTAIRDDVDSVILFNMPHLGSIARIDRKDYVLALEKMIEHFILVEEYERVPDCQSLLRQHHVNEILRTTK